MLGECIGAQDECADLGAHTLGRVVDAGLQRMAAGSVDHHHVPELPGLARFDADALDVVAPADDMVRVPEQRLDFRPMKRIGRDGTGIGRVRQREARIHPARVTPDRFVLLHCDRLGPQVADNLQSGRGGPQAHALCEAREMFCRQAGAQALAHIEPCSLAIYGLGAGTFVVEHIDHRGQIAQRIGADRLDAIDEQVVDEKEPHEIIGERLQQGRIGVRVTARGEPAVSGAYDAFPVGVADEQAVCVGPLEHARFDSLDVR